MKRLSKKLGKYFKKPKRPSLNITDPLGSTELTTSTSTRTPDPILANAALASPQAIQVVTSATAHELQVSTYKSVSASTTDLMPSVSTSATKTSSQVIRTPAVTAHELQVPVSDSVSASATNALAPVHSGSGFFANAQNVLIAGGTFINAPANTREGQIKIPVSQKPNSSPIFTGRKDILEKLGKIFVHRADTRSRRSCLLWGMGGIGKTQICLKFTEEMSDSFLHVFWVDASSHDSMVMSFKGISNLPAAQASGVDDSVESVLQWIACIQEEWLMVFDNADDPLPEVVAKFFPPGDKGNILITSRNRSMGRVISFQNIIEISEMEEADAISLLLKASYLQPLAEHLQVAKDIVTELGCIPLAVNHAGAYIEAGKCDINRYLKQFSKHRQTLMSDAAFTGASNYNQTVYGTWELSFKEIKRRASKQPTTVEVQAAQAAILILQICAFYHHSNISKDIFQSAAEGSRKNVDVVKKLPQIITLLDYTLLTVGDDGQWDDLIFGQGISVLFAFSLIKREQSPKMLSIHPLVHSWSRERMGKSEQQSICEIGSAILTYAIPWGFTSQNYALRALVVPHIKANELYARQLGLIEQYFDDRYSNFSLVMSENENWDNVEQIHLQAVNIRKRVLGPEHPYTLVSIGNLAGAYTGQGRWNEAEQLQVQVMDMTKKVLGAEHPDTLTSMADLAATYHRQKKWNEAQQLEIQVVDMRKKVLGAEHPQTLTSMGNLAKTYYSQERWNKAEQLQVQVIDMMKKVLGAEHPVTLINMAHLAATYYSQERWNKAEQLQVQVIDMMKKVLGAEHPDTLTTMGNLAETYYHQKRWNEAEQLKVDIMDMRKRH